MAMYDTQQIDILDLLIHIIKEHENKLDELISRLEQANKITLKQYLKTKQ